MSTIITALAVLALMGLAIGLLMYVHNRDQKKEALKKIRASENPDVSQ